MNEKNCEEVMEHISRCSHCQHAWYRIIGGVLADRASKAGSTKSEAKSKAARENGKLGGRPRKENGGAKTRS